MFKRLFLVVGLLSTLVALAAGSGPPTVAQADSSSSAYHNPVLGLQISDMGGLRPFVDELLGDRTYGVALVSQEGGAQGELVMRVDWMYRVGPDMDAAVRQIIASSPEFELQAVPIMVDGRAGQMVSGLPGPKGSTNVYVVANDNLYEIIYAADTLDERGKALLDNIHFVAPTRTLDSLHLERTSDHMYQPFPYDEEWDPKGDISGEGSQQGGISQALTDGIEAVPGCVDWPVSEFIQTPITNIANGNGWSKAGPSHYNEGLHRDCNLTNKINDYYALDFPLRVEDPVLAPFTGTVVWTGWASGGWSTFGKVVIVEHWIGSTKYWSMAAHLNSINVAVGNNVTASTVLGGAGRSGNNSLTYWTTSHLHQGIYRNASVSSTYPGGIYAGQSVQPLNVKYFRNGGGFYQTIGWRQDISY